MESRCWFGLLGGNRLKDFIRKVRKKIKSLNSQNMLTVAFCMGLLLVILYYQGATANISNDIGYEMQYSSELEFISILQQEEVTGAVVKNNIVYATSDIGNTYQAVMTDNILISLGLEGVSNITYIEEASVWAEYSGIFTAVLICVGVVLLIRFFMGTRGTGNLKASNFDIPVTNKTEKEAVIDMERPVCTFDEVEGIDELKPDLLRLVDCLKNPSKYEEMGARPTKGVVLYGPPGTGKTLIAKALSHEAGVPFISMCGSDFMEKYVGVGASRIRELYKKAREQAPCIIFIDEIDAIGGERGNSENAERDQTINSLLSELDGFSTTEGILTICATNRLDMLDSALTRAGRFDLKLAVSLPDLEGRRAILAVHSKNKKLGDSVDMEHLAKITSGFSGADLENILNEGALIAANNNGENISKENIEDAYFKIIMEGNKKSHKDNETFKTLCAYHEAGHALVTKLLTTDSVPSVTIVGSTSGAGGVTFITPDESTIPSKKALEADIKISYGGRAAEELYYGSDEEITTGASSDIRSATNTIKGYISKYGMGRHGLLDVQQLTNQYNIVDEAIELSNKLYVETRDLLKDNYELLEKIAKKLLEKETVYEDELDEILGKEVNLSKV